MTVVTELELPEFDYLAGDLTGDVYHRRLADVRAKGWLARSPWRWWSWTGRRASSSSAPG